VQEKNAGQAKINSLKNQFFRLTALANRAKIGANGVPVLF
jgi:hypothetical protein